MSEFIIEKGIALPPERRKSASYPLAQMEIGYSFLVVGDELSFKRARAAAAQFGKKNNMKFTSRTVEGGLRIWRFA